MTTHYKKFTRLIEKWPLDITKGERDLALFIRERVKAVFEADKAVFDSEYCSRQYAALNRIADNRHLKKYKRTRGGSATGLTTDECNVILSSEVLDYLNEDSKGFLQKVFSKSTYKNVEYKDHVPVMLKECIQHLHPQDNELLVDMTFGAGGHSRKILESSDCKLIVLDRDPVAFKMAKQLAEEYPGRVTPLLGRFSELPALLKERGLRPTSVDGMLFDFGCSSMQMDSAERGFSVSKNSLLDMRMDADRHPEQLTAREVLALATEYELTKIFKIYGDEKKAAKIARTVVEARYLFKNIETTHELAEIVDSQCRDEVRLDKLQRYTSNATKVFQALRIFVNNELNELNYGMVIAKHYLKLNGRLVTVSFHSLEDTIVKRHIAGHVINDEANPVPLKYYSHGLIQDKVTMSQLLESSWRPINKHVLVPSEDEVQRNPRSRSARLRSAVRVK